MISQEGFQQLILLLVSHKKADQFVDVLRGEFEVAASTVRRWAIGVARPHPRIRELIAERAWELL